MLGRAKKGRKVWHIEIEAQYEKAGSSDRKNEGGAWYDKRILGTSGTYIGSTWQRNFAGWNQETDGGITKTHVLPK